MKCLQNVEPIYYETENYTGLAVEPYKETVNGFEYDEIRAFVVMQFPYIYPQTDTEPSSTELVTQAFYRSSGSNSQEQFGENITDLQARGTWIPTNGLVAQPGYREHGVCVLKNSGFILKDPFVQLNELNILSRFNGDPQLALVSYFMGGGIWNVKAKVKELSDILRKQNLPDYTKKFKPGCVGLTNELVPALSMNINKYIANSVSWNWHPKDMDFLIKAALEEVNLNNETFWIENEGRYFIPKNLFLNPGVLRNFRKSSLIKSLGPKKTKEVFYRIITNAYNICPWSENSPISMFPPPNQ